MKRSIFFAAFALFAAVAFAVDAAEERDVRVIDVEVLADSFWDELFPKNPEPGCVCCLSAVTNFASGGPSRWVTFDGRGWHRLQGDVVPVEGVRHQVRVENPRGT